MLWLRILSQVVSHPMLTSPRLWMPPSRLLKLQGLQVRVEPNAPQAQRQL
jgi:hypothetical protein